MIVAVLPLVATATEPAMTARARYEAWLTSRGAASGAILEGPRLGDSPYTLLFVDGGPGNKLHPAAVTAAAVVSPEETTGWGPFLRSAAPAVVQAQIGWMEGAWVAHAPSAPVSAGVLARDPKARGAVAEPKLTDAPGGGVVFEAWYGEPPSLDPFRFRVTVDAAGQATFATDPLWKLP